MKYYNPNLKIFSRQLRKEMTEAEKYLWSKIRRKQLLNFQFYRQKAIGNYIVDFYCPRANLIIEIDGSQHYSVEGKERDKLRDHFLFTQNLKVLRFSNIEVLKNIQSVIESIYEYLKGVKNPP